MADFRDMVELKFIMKMMNTELTVDECFAEWKLIEKRTQMITRVRLSSIPSELLQMQQHNLEG